ncbi:IpaC/SipC family type III secretion system effector [Glaciimonas sp. PAMC28666]|uniref:IpaC/SipC family type III secretion system effector n=1 Tax=Glaciimonas sp. PAMC28666 TaxID=2807626 RepID=UPI00196282B8|nr:IpaC/SipC family type III secretion system effector [Glaciimonas sp. PAMC28666]QRX82148.1 hypothetical protein JQN73_18890 [Glaciimonas sp. PAMC28666]
MEIRSQPSVLFQNTTNVGRGGVTKPDEKSMPDSVSMATLVDRLPLEKSCAIVDRSALESAIILASPDKRKEIILHLNELGRASVGTPLGDLLSRKLPEVRKEESQSGGVERLLELLFSLLMILGKANTARNAAATKFGEIAVEQAALAGAKVVSAAVANLGGAVVGMALGTVAAGVGFKQFAKGTSGQIRNTSLNGREVSQLRSQNAAVKNALNRPAPPTTTSPQKTLQTLEANGKTLELQKNSPTLSTEERAVLNQTIIRTEAKIADKELASQINSQKFGRSQFAGQTVATFAQPLSAIGQASASVQASQQQAASKIADAQGAIASTIQRSEEQATQRSVDLIARAFSQIIATSEQNRATVESLGRGIKA